MLLVAFVATTHAIDACAEDARPAPAQAGPPESPAFRTELFGTLDPLQVELFHPSADERRDLPYARCTTPCFAKLPPGQYRLVVRASGSIIETSRTIEIREPSALRIDPVLRGDRYGGLALGIGGMVAAVVGDVMILSNLCIEECESDGGLLLSGLALLVGGTVASVLGWVKFGRSFRPGIDAEPLERLEPRAPEARRSSAERDRRADPRPGVSTSSYGVGIKLAF